MFGQHMALREGWRVAFTFLVEVACQLFQLHVVLVSDVSFHASEQHFSVFSLHHAGSRSCMGARDRGRVAFSSPLALQPVTVCTEIRRWRDCSFFISGFLCAVTVIWWILFGIAYVD